MVQDPCEYGGGGFLRFCKALNPKFKVTSAEFIAVFENPDVRNDPRINPRIFDIFRNFWGRVGCEKINVHWGTTKF